MGGAGAAGVMMVIIGLHRRHWGLAPYRFTIGVPLGLAPVVAFPPLLRWETGPDNAQAGIVPFAWAWEVHPPMVTAAWVVTAALLAVAMINGMLRWHAIRRRTAPPSPVPTAAGG